MIAFNDTYIYYSQQARSYALYTFLITLMLVWAFLLAKGRSGRWFWIAGTALMAAILYTHYIGVLYVGCIVAAIIFGKTSKRVKFLASLSCFVAFISFLPWLAVEWGVYLHKGINQNLDWQGLPTIYDLKFIWAQSIGVPDFKGATTFALFIGLGLLIANFLIAPILKRNHGETAPLPAWCIMALLLTALVPPVVLFGLGRGPLRLPLFGTRHLLPSVVPFCLLCSNGLQELATRLGRRRLILSVGAAILMALGFVPTAAALRTLPRRVPYDRIARDLNGPVLNSWNAYTPWFYGIGQCVNFYSSTARVSSLPTAYESLPRQLIFLYRPDVPEEQLQLDRLVHFGYASLPYVNYYSAGRGRGFGMKLVVLWLRHGPTG
jgi:4-amino-4-deoxy-L-arabinose transferase-like glycosyltransferase